jgi:hypothetical protein
MKNSPLTINGKELAARWDIETIDLLYIMLNHGLNVVDQIDDEVDVGDVLEDFRNNKDASGYMFLLSEVKAIETNFEVDGKIPHAETIRGKDLMARWKMHDAQIFRVMFNAELAAIDSFGHDLDSIRIFSLLNDNTFDLSYLLFRLSDTKEFESEHPEIVSGRIDDKKPEKKLRPNQIHKIKCREVAQRLWEENPAITIREIGDMPEIMEVSKRTDGNYYSEKTIRNWIKDLCPDRSPGRRPQKP